MSNVELNQGSPGSRPVDWPTIGQGAGEHAIVAAKKATDARRLTRGQLFRCRFMRNRGAVLAGWKGAFAAVLGMLLPPFLCILLLSSLILNHLSNLWMIAFFAGASAEVVVVI